MRGLFLAVAIVCTIQSLHCEDVRLLDLEPTDAQQLIEKQDTTLKYAPKVESNVPAVRFIGNEQQNVVEDIYLANQYHGQDGLGGYLYGYAVPDIAKTEKKVAGGDLRGSYNYIAGDGQEIKVEYWDDGHGFHQIDNVPKILPKQIDDLPEVAAAKAEHLRLWHEQAERNSHPIASPFNAAGEYATGPLSKQGQLESKQLLAQQPQQHYQQQASNPNVQRLSQENQYQPQQQKAFAQQTNQYQQQKPFGQQAGSFAQAPKPQGQYQGHHAAVVQDFGQSNPYAQQQQQATQQFGQQVPNQQHAGVTQQFGQQIPSQQFGHQQTAQAPNQQHAPGTQQFGQTQTSHQFGQQGHNTQQVAQQTFAQPKPNAYQPAQNKFQGSFGAANQIDKYSGQHSENQNSYSQTQKDDDNDDGSYKGTEEEDGAYKPDEEEEKGPPRGFFYNFDYPVGIIVQKQSALQKRELQDVYSTNKAAFEQQLQAGGTGGKPGSYLVV